MRNYNQLSHIIVYQNGIKIKQKKSTKKYLKISSNLIVFDKILIKFEQNINKIELNNIKMNEYCIKNIKINTPLFILQRHLHK